MNKFLIGLGIGATVASLIVWRSLRPSTARDAPSPPNATLTSQPPVLPGAEYASPPTARPSFGPHKDGI